MVATMEFRIVPQHEGCFVPNLFEIVPVVRSGEEDETTAVTDRYNVQRSVHNILNDIPMLMSG